MPSTRLASRWLPAVLAAVLPALPARAADERPRAVILLDRAPSDPSIAAAQVRVARDRLGAAWRIDEPSSLPGLALPDPACDAAPRTARAARVMEALRVGTARFYEETDVDGSRDALQKAMDDFLEAPCALAADPRARSEAVAGAVLLLRLHLLSGRPEAAADLGRRLLRTFGADELAAVDVPPEVTEFLDRVREDAAAAAVRLEVALTGPAGRLPILVDGRVLPAGTAVLAVARGTHAVTVLSDGGARTIRTQVDGATRVVLDPELSSALRPGPEGSLVVDLPVAAPEDLAARLSSATGRTVLRLSGAGSAAPVEVSVAADPAARPSPGTVLRVEGVGAGGSGPAVVIASGPLVRRKAWPWPWVTGAASAGLLAAGIVLNVEANRAADAVNSGTNHLSDWRSRRAGSIACYALAAAAGAGSVVLAVLGRPAAERVVVAPLPGGASVAVRGAF